MCGLGPKASESWLNAMPPFVAQGVREGLVRRVRILDLCKNETDQS